MKLSEWMKPGPLAALLIGMVMGFMAAVFGTAQAMAVMTAERNRDRDEQRDTYSAQVNTVINKAAEDLATMRDDRDQAIADLDAKQPKGGLGG